MTPPRVLLIGLDGMTFDVLKPLTEQGIMPTMASIMERGAWGTMQSTVPPLTGPAWTSFYTGKKPGNHGLFDFFKPSPMDNEAGIGRRLINSREVDGKALWSILTDHDLTSLVLNVPVTYPPTPIKGAMFTGMLTPSVDGNLTHPKNLYQKYKPDLGDYTITINWQNYKEAQAVEFVRELIRCQEQRTKYTLRLMDDWPDWNLAFPCFTETDRIQHALWHYIDPKLVEREKERGTFNPDLYELILDFWRECDRCVARLIEKAGGEDVPVFFVSDHGFGSLDGKVMLNHHLREAGLITVRDSKLRQVRHRLFMKKAFEKSLHTVGLLKWYKARQTRDAEDRVAGAAKSVYDMFYESIDWERTKAYLGSNTEGALYLNVKGRGLYGDVEPGTIEPEDYEKVRAEVIEVLKSIKHPDTGKPMMTYVATREEVYSGKYESIAPDIVYFFDGGGWLANFQFGLGPFKPSTWKDGSGTHRMDGIFIAAGPGITHNPEIETEIWNVTPTILAYMGLPIPADMDGKCIEAAFQSEWLDNHEIVYAEPGAETDTSSGAEVFDDEDEEVLVERLRGLGYLD